MDLTILQKFDINSLKDFQLLPEVADHHIAAKGLLSGQPVIFLLTEEKMDRISDNVEMVRFIASSAVYLEEDAFILPLFLLDYAHIESSAYIVKDEESKYYVCSARAAEEMMK